MKRKLVRAVLNTWGKCMLARSIINVLQGIFIIQIALILLLLLVLVAV